MKLRVGTLFVAAAVVAAWMTFGPAAMGGGVTYVTTHGNSMEPQFHTGDLAILRTSSTYNVGDVAAYRSSTLKVAVMHRIVAVNGGHYTFKGDNNSWVDTEAPTASDLIGKLAVRIPQGGIWFQRATSPAVLGGVAFLLLASGGSVVQTRRRRRKGTMSRPVALPSRPSGTLLGTAPSWLRSAIATTAFVGIVGLALAAAAWHTPATGPVTTQVKGDRGMTFSYSTTVPQTPAYDDTTVNSPDPVFRTVAGSVDVHYSYRGSPGTVAVSAVLTTPSGWRSVVQLSPAKSITTTRYNGTVRLHLAALQARADAAAVVTGLPGSPVTVTVKPLVTTPGASDFTPVLRLTLSPLQLALADLPKALVIDDPTTESQVNEVPRTMGTASLHMTISQARSIGSTLALAALLAIALLAPIALTSAPKSEGAGIRRRYGQLLVSVEPMATPPGRPLVDVEEFATLARLAERFGLLVLHWTRSDIDTFVVQDEGTTYRYRTNALIPGAPGDAEFEASGVPTQRTATTHRATSPRATKR